MQEEHRNKINESFDLLERALNETEWEFVTEKRGVTVSYFLFPGDSISTFKGEGVIATVCNHTIIFFFPSKNLYS